MTDGTVGNFVTRHECDEREHRFEDAIAALKELLMSNLSAVKELTAQSFQAAKEAKTAADAALKEYKAQSNEIRSAMSDLSSHMMPRTESESHWQTTNQRLDEVKQQFQEKIENQTTRVNELSTSVMGIRGQEAGKEKTINLANWGFGLIAVVLLGLLGIIGNIIMFIISYFRKGG